MRVKHAPIVEVEKLMLAASFDARDPRARHRSELRRCESTLQRRMKQLHTRDRSSLRTGAKELQGSFDFGKFRHGSGLVALTRLWG
jgi:hypothetical protein